MCPQLHFLRQREQKKMVPGIWSASRKKPGGTSAFHSSELLSCSPMTKPLLSPKPATAIRFLKPRSESKEISKSPQTVLQCEYQMVSLKSFEEPSHIPREWCSLITVPEMKGLGGLIRQLENKLYYMRLKELKPSAYLRGDREVDWSWLGAYTWKRDPIAGCFWACWPRPDKIYCKDLDKLGLEVNHSFLAERIIKLS